MRNQGKITDWQDDRGFGFITPSVGRARVFVHITAFKKGQRRPCGSERVTYEVYNDPKKGPRAQNVEFYGVVQPPPRKEGRRVSKFLHCIRIAWTPSFRRKPEYSLFLNAGSSSA
jgi:cold shock CspA family protein